MKCFIPNNNSRGFEKQVETNDICIIMIVLSMHFQHFLVGPMLWTFIDPYSSTFSLIILISHSKNRFITSLTDQPISTKKPSQFLQKLSLFKSVCVEVVKVKIKFYKFLLKLNIFLQGRKKGEKIKNHPCFFLKSNWNIESRECCHHL